MHRGRVEQAIEYVKGSLETMDYGKWGLLNSEQRHFIRDLCKSWLVLDDATNYQMIEIGELKKEIERLNNIIKEAKEYVYVMFNIEPANSREYDYHCGKLAEILDKGSDKE